MHSVKTLQDCLDVIPFHLQGLGQQLPLVLLNSTATRWVDDGTKVPHYLMLVILYEDVLVSRA